MRVTIPDFQLANPLYAGATVTLFTVDSNGVKTTTKATIYDAPTGTGTLANPLRLDGEGKFIAIPYVDVPVIATVSGLSISDHDTGVIRGDPAERLIATSTTSLVIGTGSKTFTVEDDRLFDVGTFLIASSDAGPSNYMHGQVSAYAGTTLTINVTSIGGSGTFADWTIQISGPRGAQGATGASGSGSGDVVAANNGTDFVSPAAVLTNIGGVPTSRTISAGSGLSGGGTLAANRTLALDIAGLTGESAIVSGDEFPFNDISVPALRKITLTQLSAALLPSISQYANEDVVNATNASWPVPVAARKSGVLITVLAAGGSDGSGDSFGNPGGTGSGGQAVTIIADLTGVTTLNITIGATGSPSGGNTTVAGYVVARGGNAGTTAAGLPGVHGAQTSIGLPSEALKVIAVWVGAGGADGGTGPLGGTGTNSGAHGRSGQVRFKY